ncbi:hypothetical protein N9L20_03500 [Flavobacteriaceae bacterium]|nr:hypothetical protein [Flavobacteriaceae bacterium]
MKKTLLKYLVFPLIGITLLFQGAIFAINLSLPGILEDNLDETFELGFSTIDFSFWKRSIEISELKVNTNPQQVKLKSTLEGEIKTILISEVSIFKLLFKKQIKTGLVSIIEPNLQILNTDVEKRTVTNSKTLNEFFKDFFHSIEVKNIELKNGLVKSIDLESNATSFYCEHINFEITDVTIDSLKVTNPLPFEFSTFKIRVGSLYGDLGELYRIEVDSFASSNNTLLIDNLKLSPSVSKSEFESKIEVEQDYITATVDSIRMDRASWSFLDDNLLIAADNLELSQADISFYRNKELPDNTKTKQLYSKLLRELPFLLNINNLTILDTNLTIEEHRPKKEDTGQIYIREIYGKGQHLSNFNYQNDDVPFEIQMTAKFFDNADLEANFSLLVRDPKDSYHLTGALRKFDMSKMNAFTVPNMGVGIEGYLNEIVFDINGDDDLAKGRISTSYEDLKIAVYNQNLKKRKLVSAAGNWIVKGEIENETVDIEVERNKEKSMFNNIIKSFIAALKKEAI